VTTVSIRLPGGVHKAVSELAERAGVDKTDMATILVWNGMSWENHGSGNLSKPVRQAFEMDLLEAFVSTTRAFSELPKEKQEKVRKEFGHLYGYLAQAVTPVVPE